MIILDLNDDLKEFLTLQTVYGGCVMNKYIDLIAALLLVIGGLNWGLVAFFDFNIVSFIFQGSVLEQVIYGVVALSAIYSAFNLKAHFEG